MFVTWRHNVAVNYVDHVVLVLMKLTVNRHRTDTMVLWQSCALNGAVIGLLMDLGASEAVYNKDRGQGGLSKRQVKGKVHQDATLNVYSGQFWIRIFR